MCLLIFPAALNDWFGSSVYMRPRIEPGTKSENRCLETFVDLKHIFYYINNFNGLPVVFRCRAERQRELYNRRTSNTFTFVVIALTEI